MPGLNRALSPTLSSAQQMCDGLADRLSRHSLEKDEARRPIDLEAVILVVRRPSEIHARKNEPKRPGHLDARFRRKDVRIGCMDTDIHAIDALLELRRAVAHALQAVSRSALPTLETTERVLLSDL